MNRVADYTLGLFIVVSHFLLIWLRAREEPLTPAALPVRSAKS